MQFQDYPVMVKTKDGSFFLSISELGIFADGSSLETAFKNLKEKFEDHKRIAAEFEIKIQPTPVQVRNRIKEELKIFFIKTAIVSLIVVVLTVMFTPVFTSIVRHEIKNTFGIENKSIKDLTIRLPKEFNNRWSTLTPDEVKELKEEWKKTFQTLAPFVSEAKINFNACQK